MKSLFNRNRSEKQIQDDMTKRQASIQAMRNQIKSLEAEIGATEDGADTTAQAVKITSLHARIADVPRQIKELENELQGAIYRSKDKTVKLAIATAQGKAQRAHELKLKKAAATAELYALEQLEHTITQEANAAKENVNRLIREMEQTGNLPAERKAAIQAALSAMPDYRVEMMSIADAERFHREIRRRVYEEWGISADFMENRANTSRRIEVSGRAPSLY